MSEWQPIVTALKDGTRILIANDKLFTAASWEVWIEPEFTCLGYDEGCVYEDGPFAGRPRIGLNFNKRIANPKTGKTAWQGWNMDNPIAFRNEDKQSPDCDGLFDLWEPTYWAHMQVV